MIVLHRICQRLLLLTMLVGAATWGAAQSPTQGAAPSAKQLKKTLKTESKRMQKLIAKADWANDSALARVARNLGAFAVHAYEATTATDPAAKSLANDYLTKYKGFLDTYQSKADLAKQDMMPPLNRDLQLQAQAAFARVVKAYAFLKATDQLPKRSWGEQDFVDQIKLQVDELNASAPAYASLDPQNYGKIERYTAAAKAYEALWEERRMVPEQLQVAEKWLRSQEKPYLTLSQAAPTFEDHDALLRANQEFSWEELRNQVAFMNQWEYRQRGGVDEPTGDLARWIVNWPADNKLVLSKQISGAKAAATLPGPVWTRWQGAKRYLSLLQSAALIYPSDPDFSGNLAAGEALVAETQKAFEATLTSDYHRTHLGELGLSKTGATGFQPLTAFKAGERVVLTVFLDRPAGELSPTGKFELKLTGIGEQFELLGFRVASADLGKNYIDIVLMGDQPYAPDTRMAEEGLLVALCLAEGKVVNLDLSLKVTLPGRTSFGAPLQLSFDGTSAPGIAAYRGRWTKLTSGH